jgi:hypothetical protein
LKALIVAFKVYLNAPAQGNIPGYFGSSDDDDDDAADADDDDNDDLGETLI